MSRKSAYIIIDSGFDQSVLAQTRHVLAAYDLPSDTVAVGQPFLTPAALSSVEGDNCGNHGTEVLRRLLNCVPDAHLVLVRCIAANGRIARTRWRDDSRVTDGWSIAYLKAVDLCQKRGYNTVANCSFGGYIHAMDGTGWEAHCISQVTGPGKPGHIMVAAAGPGDGRADHASVQIAGGTGNTTRAYQEGTTDYNFWAGGASPWQLRVTKDGQQVMAVSSQSVPANIWNGQQQQTFQVPGNGLVALELTVEDAGVQGCNQFHCWVEGPSSFLNNIDPVSVAEPACFPTVLAVGLRNGKYNPRQRQLKSKPDVLLRGDGPVSFRAPEVTAAVGRLLECDSSLDLTAIRGLLGKYPDPTGF